MFNMLNDAQMQKQLRYLVKCAEEDGAIVEKILDHLIKLIPSVLEKDFELSLCLM